MMLYRTTLTSPVGDLRIIASDAGVREIRMQLPDHRSAPMRATEQPDHPVLVETCRQLDEYFRGERRDFALPLDVKGTDFQRTVWNALTEIPYGETASYGDVAEQIGRPGAARAVGGANGRNPVPIVVPCHRVIGASGAMVGYGGPGEDGIAIKRWLIRHESEVGA
jgi:methylated-DNA-[protein]-cysteine S-methyltransferase